MTEGEIAFIVNRKFLMLIDVIDKFSWVEL